MNFPKCTFQSMHFNKFLISRPSIKNIQQVKFYKLTILISSFID